MPKTTLMCPSLSFNSHIIEPLIHSETNCNPVLSWLAHWTEDNMTCITIILLCQKNGVKIGNRYYMTTLPLYVEELWPTRMSTHLKAQIALFTFHFLIGCSGWIKKYKAFLLSPVIKAVHAHNFGKKCIVEFFRTMFVVIVHVVCSITTMRQCTKFNMLSLRYIDIDSRFWAVYQLKQFYVSSKNCKSTFQKLPHSIH